MTDHTPVTLFGESHWDSPFVFTAVVALEEKRVPYEVVPFDLDKKEHLANEAFVRGSLTERVPAIRHGGFWLSESSAIVEYLEEIFPIPKHDPLLPEGPWERARARQVMAWLRSDLYGLREDRPTTTMFYERATAPLSSKGRAAADKLIRVTEALLPSTGAPPFGVNFCLADADLSFMLHRLILNGDDVPPRVRAYAEKHWARPSVQVFVRHAR
ncbi:MAG: glutathione transferase [Deltaproteobacteria bacterium]|nr:glutathione transferase [Deltaproteobacteria bacterium]